ncbi:MAG TPA: ATP-binding cassette domain-containing protein [Planctomycetota bacterium]|nr:ATP-binding cassette domain-containing protein [Planctomycetota bacterium]
MIQVSHIFKRYGATLAVNDVSFEVDKGEIVGFLGPNGAGKSTTLKILTGYVVADSGNVVVAGKDVLEDSLGVKQSVGYLPETTPLYPDMQVGDYLRFMARARQVPKAQVSSAVDRVVDLVGIRRMFKKNIAFLSKGYKQRVGLAQALIHDPPVIIMDEPTSGLDPHQIIEIRELIRDLGRKKLVLLSSHILQEISAICTRILVIKDGRIVANGSPEDLRREVSDRAVVRARIRGEEQTVRDKLKSIRGVESADVVGQGDGFQEWRVSAAAGTDLGVEVARLARQENWDLAALMPEAASLEDVYLQLTASPATRAAS